MTYSKQSWQNDSTATPVSAARLLVMEQGIFDAHYLSCGKVSRSTAPGAGTATVVGFDAAVYDTSGTSAMWVVGQPTRLVAPKAGYYIVGANYAWSVAPTGAYVGAKIRHSNGNTICQQIIPTAYTLGYESSICGGVFMSVGEYIELVYVCGNASANMIAGGITMFLHQMSY